MTSARLAERLHGAGSLAQDADDDAGVLSRIRALLEHEPFLFAAAHQPGPSDPWTVKVPAVLRKYRYVTSVDGYTVTALVEPPEPPPYRHQPGPLISRTRSGIWTRCGRPDRRAPVRHP